MSETEAQITEAAYIKGQLNHSQHNCSDSESLLEAEGRATKWFNKKVLSPYCDFICRLVLRMSIMLFEA